MIEKIKEILKGIDKDISQNENGWWETSTGAEFGAKKLKQIEDLVKKITIPDAAKQKLYYWKKQRYHEGAAFALAESVDEAKRLIIEKFKSNWLEDNKNECWVQHFISNGRTNEEEFFTEETNGAYTLLKEEIEKEPKIFDLSKQGFYIWASL